MARSTDALLRDVEIAGIIQQHPEWPEKLSVLVPFQDAGMRGLQRSRWRPGQPVEDLVAPIVLAVLAEVARQGLISSAGGGEISD